MLSRLEYTRLQPLRTYTQLKFLLCPWVSICLRRSLLDLDRWSHVGHSRRGSCVCICFLDSVSIGAQSWLKYILTWTGAIPETPYCIRDQDKEWSYAPSCVSCKIWGALRHEKMPRTQTAANLSTSRRIRGSKRTWILSGNLLQAEEYFVVHAAWDPTQFADWRKLCRISTMKV
jgi:hypothetical protein